MAKKVVFKDADGNELYPRTDANNIVNGNYYLHKVRVSYGDSTIVTGVTDYFEIFVLANSSTAFTSISEVTNYLQSSSSLLNMSQKSFLGGYRITGISSSLGGSTIYTCTPYFILTVVSTDTPTLTPSYALYGVNCTISDSEFSWNYVGISSNYNFTSDTVYGCM